MVEGKTLLDSEKSLSDRLQWEQKKTALNLKEQLRQCGATPKMLVEQRVISRQPLLKALEGVAPISISTMVSIQESLGCCLELHFLASGQGVQARSLPLGNASERELAWAFSGFFKPLMPPNKIKELAMLSQLSETTVRNLRMGGTAPRLATVFKIARALGYETYLTASQKRAYRI